MYNRSKHAGNLSGEKRREITEKKKGERDCTVHNKKKSIFVELYT